MRVMITGAAGRIGSEVVQEMDRDHDLVLVDRAPTTGRRLVIDDLSRHRRRRRWLAGPLPKWDRALDGVDAVVHLAAEPSAAAPWNHIERDNIRATWNILHAVRRRGVPKVVYASSHRVMLGHVQDRAPACYAPEGEKIGHGECPRPIEPYGVSKVCGELLGQIEVEQHGLDSFVAVRIGSFKPEPALDDTRHTWVSPHDLRTLFRHVIDTELAGFHIVYGISGQRSSPYDLSHTRDLLSWKPADAS